MIAVCPSGHRFRVRVLWGMPTPEAMAEAEAGRLILGGCDPEASVTLTCPRDGQTFERASTMGVRQTTK